MDLVIRALVISLVVYAVTRAVGKRELSTLEPFDLILLVVIGDLVQQGVTQSDYSVTGAITVICTVALVSVGLSTINFRIPRLRGLLEGEPVVLVEDGRLLERNMKRERITREDIEATARKQQVLSLDDIRWAVLETTGEISIIPRGS
jgi:uncharacterized membrane protein YcaP (DUF421 family)